MRLPSLRACKKYRSAPHATLNVVMKTVMSHQRL